MSRIDTCLRAPHTHEEKHQTRGLLAYTKPHFGHFNQCVLKLKPRSSCTLP